MPGTMSPLVVILALSSLSTLVAADHDLNMQCVAKMKSVAIDTEDENGGVARTSFLYVEVEADQQITVEPNVCPEGTIAPMKIYEMSYAADQAEWSCGDSPSPQETIECTYEPVPADYELFLDNPAKYACLKQSRTWTDDWGSNTETYTQCGIWENSNGFDNVCCPPDKSTLIMRQPTGEEWMQSNENNSPTITLGRCTAARFTETQGNDVDLTTVAFDTSDRVSPVQTERMDGQDGRDGPYTIKDVYKKLGPAAKDTLKHSFWPNLLASDTVVSLTGVTGFSEQEILAYFDGQELMWNDCNGPNPEDCFERSETVASLGGTSFLGFDPDDPDACEIDFPQMEKHQVSQFLSHMAHMSGCWDCGYNDSPIAQAITVRYKNCNAALMLPATLGIPPLAKDNIAGYFANFHNDPVPGNNQIRSDMKLSPFKSAVSKNITNKCTMLVTLVDVPTMVDPQELVSIDGVSFADLKSIYDSVPDAYIVLDAFTVLARTTGLVPGFGKTFTVVTKDTTTSVVNTWTNITATTGAYSSLKSKLDTRNDLRWEQNFACGGMDSDRLNGKIKLVDTKFTRTAGYLLDDHLNFTAQPGGRDEAIEGMKDNLLSFAFYLGSRSLETGQYSSAFQWENELWGGPDNADLTIADFEGCQIQVDACYGADGGGIPMQPAENTCSYDTLKEVVLALNATMEKTEKGEVLTNYVDYLQHMGTDAWVDCISIVTNSMEDAWATETQETTECVVPDPCDWMTMDQSNETHVEACNYGTWGYCTEHPTDTWCADPCCNWDKQQTMCCAPKNATVSVFRPKLKTESYVMECLSNAFENSKTADLPSGDLDSLKCVDPTDATMAADFIAGKLQNPKLCMSKYLEVNKIVTEINTDLECCLSAVVGVESWDNGYSMKSTQPCENDDNCESGTCLIAGDNAEKDTPTDDGCAWSTATRTNRCAMTGSDASGAAIARCLERRLRANTKVTNEVVATVKKVLGGSSQASNADIGNTITSVAITQTCMGDGDAWKYDSNCWGSECSDCEGDTDCKAACIGVEACNWKPRTWNSTACNLGDWENCETMTTEEVCEATAGYYCLGTTDWGSSEDLTQNGYCRPQVPAYYGKYDETYTWETDHWRHESMSINSSVCSTLSTDIGAGGLEATNVPWDKHSTDPAKMCTFSGPDMNSVKATCLDTCTGSVNGFQPAAKNQCYVEPNVTTGKCPTTGFFTVRQEDWNFHVPEGVSRPAFCVSEYWGPNNLYEQFGDPDPDETLAGAAQTKAGWTVDITGSAGADVATRNLMGSEWETITGFARWEGFVFTSEEQATKYCTDTGVGALVREVDDGSDYCWEDRCWFARTGIDIDNGGTAVTSESQCSTVQRAFGAIASTDGFWTQWAPEMRGGTGVCSFTAGSVRTENDDWDTWRAKYSTWEVGSTASKHFKTLCEAVTHNSVALNPTFYVGREFTEGTMDTVTKCTQEYCNILGKDQDVDSATCTSLGGVCKTQGLGCGGCRAPNTAEVTSPLTGMCYRPGVSDANKVTLCTALGGVYTDAALQLCRFDAFTTFDTCSSPNKWLECEDIDDAVCGAATPVTTTVHGYASNHLSCKATKEKVFCKTQEQCETETGSCSSSWGPQLKEELCVWNNTDYTETCSLYSDVCVTTKPEGSWECLDHTCVGNPNAQNHTYQTMNATGHYVEVTETYCWDEKRVSVNNDQCTDYYVTSESDCDAKNGEWTSTNITSQETFCTSSKRCVGGRSEIGWTEERDEVQCLLCGGRMVSDSTWDAGTWVEPAMVASGNTWQTRGYEPNVNSWSGRIDRWRVQDLLSTVEMSLREEAYSVFARCQYGQVGESLEQLAGVCSGMDLATRAEVLDKASKLLNNMTAYNNTEMTIGNPGDTNLQPSENSTDGDASYSVDTAIVRVPTHNDTLAAVCMGTFVTKIESAVTNSSDTDSSSSSNSTRRRRNNRRKLTQEEADDASLQDAGCWSRVRNDDDVLVGQLLGECVEISLGVGQQLLDGVRACLRTKPERPFGEGYTTDAFVKRTTTNGVDSFTPVDIAVERVGSQLCGKISEIGAFFCPARVTASWETASTDVGSTECTIVDVIAAAREAAIAQIAANQQAADSDDDGAIPGLDETSGALVLAAAALLFAAICTFVCVVCVRRHRRLAREANCKQPASTTTPKKSGGKFCFCIDGGSAFGEAEPKQSANV